MLKTCPFCKKVWEKAEDIVEDETIYISGYQSNFDVVENGFYIFWHKAENCGTSFAVPVGEFFHLHKGPKYEESKAMKEGCNRLCLEQNQLQSCENTCKYAFIRDIIQLFKKSPIG